MLTSEKIDELQEIAKANDGRCDRCNRVLAIYKYKVNVPMVAFLRAAARSVDDSQKNDFDASTLGLPYSVRTQSSKLRQHGLIARVKGDDGVQLPSRWLITRKGWSFLNGEPVPAKVIVFENQVIGHDGGELTIREVSGEPNINESRPITPPESKEYSNLREPRKGWSVRAKYRGITRAGLERGVVYDVEIKKIVVGQPVEMISPAHIQYHDIARFQSEWQIIKEEHNATETTKS